MIFTFYSYKGGVGRSMALANLAHLLYLRGLNVVMVDWDLEAPGLENFFFQSEADLDRARSHIGVIDAVSSYQRQASRIAAQAGFDDLPPLEPLLLDVTPQAIYRPDLSPTRGRLRLLTAGWRSGDRFREYAEAVQTFNWSALYSLQRGHEYFNWFEKQLRALGDVVLIDSRTGVSEMSGVGTRQLADVVVVVCAPNSQNLRGTIDMVESFISPEVTKARGRDVRVVVLPARVDDADSEAYQRFQREFTNVVRPYVPDVFQRFRRTSWDLMLPYKAQYAFRESLVTGVEGANASLEQAYTELAAHLALVAGRGDPMWRACAPELRVLHARAGVEFIDTPAWEELDRWPADQLDAARSVLLRMVNLSPASAEHDSRRVASTEELMTVEASDALPRLIAAGIVKKVESEGSGVEQYEIADESTVRTWSVLRRWILADRRLLLWRQDVADQVRKWKVGNNDPALLLRGAPLDEARHNAEEFASHLTPTETQFVQQSVAAAAASAALANEEARQRRELEEAERVYMEASQARQRKAARLRRFALAALTLLVPIGFFAWALWTRSDRYQADQAYRLGLRITGGQQYAPSPWRTALLASGHVDAALAEVRAAYGSFERAGALAQAAALLQHLGRSSDASRIAVEALDLPLTGAPDDFANATANVLLTLQSGGVTVAPDKITSLLSVVRQIPEHDRQLAILEKLLPLSSQDAQRLYFETVQHVSDPFRRSNAYQVLARMLSASNAEMARQAATLAVEAARNSKSDELIADALIGAYTVSRDPASRDEARKAATSISDVRQRAHMLGALAQAIENVTEDKAMAENVWRDALSAAYQLAGVDLVNALYPIALALQTGGFSSLSEDARGRLRQAALDLPASPDRRDAIARAAIGLAIAGDFDQAIALAVDQIAEPLSRAELLAQIAAASKPDQARQAARAADLMFGAAGTRADDDPLAAYAPRMLAILYAAGGDADARAQALKMPLGWLALTSAAREGGHDAAAENYRQQALTLARAQAGPGQSPDSSILKAIAIGDARYDRLRESLALASECRNPDDQLAVYAAVLLAYTIEMQPSLAKIRDILSVKETGS